jgi:hypothetical protein
MLLEMSMVMTIAIPSCFTSMVSPPIRSPAAPTMSAARLSARSAGGTATHHRRALTVAGIETSL